MHPYSIDLELIKLAETISKIKIKNFDVNSSNLLLKDALARFTKVPRKSKCAKSIKILWITSNKNWSLIFTKKWKWVSKVEPKAKELRYLKKRMT